MLNNFKKILVLAPHTDDGELGCGGTIAKFIVFFYEASEGKEIYFSSKKILKNITLNFKK